MKKILMVCLLLFLAACSSEDTSEKNVKVDDYKTSVQEALKQMGDDTELEVISDEMVEENRHSLALNEDTFIFIDVDGETIERVILAAKPTAAELVTAFTLLVGTADESLSMADRNKLIDELGLRNEDLTAHIKTVEKNNIQYTFKGDSESLLLEAKY